MAPALIVGVIVIVGVVFVAVSLRQPDVPVYTPTPPGVAGNGQYTVDATSPDNWQYFSFSRGMLIKPTTSTDWDLAFQRFHIKVNEPDTADIAHWYKYSFTSHILKPKPHEWLVRSARVRILSYYCPGAQPGCVTFAYAYHGAARP